MPVIFECTVHRGTLPVLRPKTFEEGYEALTHYIKPYMGNWERWAVQSDGEDPPSNGAIIQYHDNKGRLLCKLIYQYK